MRKNGKHPPFPQNGPQGQVLSLFGLKDRRTGPFKKARTVDTLYLTNGSLVARPDARLGEPGEELPGRESREDLAVLGEGDAGGGDPAARVVGHHVRRVVLVHGQAAVRVPHVEAEARHGEQ